MAITARILSSALWLALVTCCPLTAIAGPITFDFTGTVQERRGGFSGAFGVFSAPVGTTVTGSYSYDTDALQIPIWQDTPPSSTGMWRSVEPGNEALTWDITVNVNGVERSTSQSTAWHTLDIRDDPTDVFHFYAYEGHFQEGGALQIDKVTAQILLQDFDGLDANGKFVSDAISKTLNGPPTEPPELSLFSFNCEVAVKEGCSFLEWIDPNNTQAHGVYFSIDSISLRTTAVSEPGSLSLLALGLAAIGLAGRRRKR